MTFGKLKINVSDRNRLEEFSLQVSLLLKVQASKNGGVFDKNNVNVFILIFSTNNALDIPIYEDHANSAMFIRQGRIYFSLK